jgi:hypothetical protein
MLASRGDQPGYAKVGTVGQQIIDINNVGAPTLQPRVTAGSGSLIRRLTSSPHAIACETPWGDLGVDLTIFCCQRIAWWAPFSSCLIRPSRQLLMQLG